MSQLIVVEGCSLQATSGTVSIISAGCVLLGTVMCQGKKAYNAIAFTVSDPPFSGGGVIIGNSLKVKSNGLSAVLDDAQIIVTLTAPNGATKACTVSIADAGQSKARGV